MAEFRVSDSGQSIAPSHPTCLKTTIVKLFGSDVSPLSSIVNEAGLFFNSWVKIDGKDTTAKSILGKFAPNNDKGREGLILHELAHLIFKDGQPLIKDDKNDLPLSEKK